MRTALTLAFLVLLLGVAGTAQYHYAFYYNTLGERDLEINLISTVPDMSQYVISVHDAYGMEIWSYSGDLGPGAADVVSLRSVVAGIPNAWGVVTVDTSERFLIGLEYSVGGVLVSTDTISRDVPVLDPTEPFWLGAYYTQVREASTAYVVMNPWNETVTCAVTVFNSLGKRIDERTFTLAPFESEDVGLTPLLGHGSLLWGLLNVRMEKRAVILALEYTGRGAGGLEVENVTQYYY
ncbi:MAG: hypothetical protein PHX77_03230 [Candidatus Bipolaricaulis sp.]|nr:hypothetical protein [Candidatus Bipolaricaulis sp.]MDD5645602.1 hypothetical protein [Candidatus Bipolaricaulis sp.]